MATPRILAFAGSARVNSFNKKLIQIAANGARSAGAEVTLIDLRDFPTPLFDLELEAAEGEHPNARKLKDLMLSHHGFLIASPEHNSSISALLKNTIDWASRKAGEEKPLECFTGKVAGIMSASPGALGGLRGLVHVRSILENINTIVIPNQVAVSKANEAFNEDGALKDAKQQANVEQIGAKLAGLLAKLHA